MPVHFPYFFRNHGKWKDFFFLSGGARGFPSFDDTTAAHPFFGLLCYNSGIHLRKLVLVRTYSIPKKYLGFPYGGFTALSKRVLLGMFRFVFWFRSCNIRFVIVTIHFFNLCFSEYSKIVLRFGLVITIRCAVPLLTWSVVIQKCFLFVLSLLFENVFFCIDCRVVKALHFAFMGGAKVQIRSGQVSKYQFTVAA